VKEEAALRKRIEPRLRNRGALVWPVSDARLVGLPDTNILFNGVPVYAEFKAAKGVLAPHQKIWLQSLAAHGGVALEVRADPTGVAPWLAKYRRMGPKGEWLSDYTMIDSDLWLERLIQQ
jgi:hypothetical protein